MAKYHRTKGIEFVIDTPSDQVFAAVVQRTVPAGDDDAFMRVKVYRAYEEDGAYDPDDTPVVDIDIVDTLELQCILKELCHEVAQLTNVHIQ